MGSSVRLAFEVIDVIEAKAKLGEAGRLVIPAEFRRALGLEAGDEVLVVLDGDELRILTAREAVRRAQALVGRYVAATTSLAEELIAERRASAYDE